MARIPNNMTEMLYIIGHGNEYVDTGIHLDNDCLVKSRWSFNGTAACIYGCFTSSAHTDNFCLYGGSSGSDAYIRFNGQLVRSFRPTSYTIYNFEHSADGFFVNGTRHATFSAATFTCSASLRIFGLPNSHYDPLAGRCYGFQIFKKRSVPGLPEETNLMYNFVPVKNNDTGEIGLYETVNGKFYGNDGSGSFAASPEVVTRPIAGRLSYFRRRLMRSAVEIEDYITFADPVVEQICVSTWGDGIGVKPSQLARVTSLGSVFRGNTGMTSFNELEYFIGLTTITASAFTGCSNLTEVTLPSATTAIGAYAFNGCSKLTTVHYNGTGNFSVAAYAVRYCYLLNSFPTEHIGSMSGEYNFHNHKMTYMEFNDTLSTITSRGFISSLAAGTPQTVVMRRTTPPTLGNDQVFHRDSGGGSFYINTGIKIYVPYSSDHSILNAYKTTGNWTRYASYIYELDEDGNIPA